MSQNSNRCFQLTPMPLTEETVEKLFKECGLKEGKNNLIKANLFMHNQEYFTIFNTNSIIDNLLNIHYLFGQLKNAHTQTRFFDFKQAVFTYQNTAWTKDTDKLLMFIQLGIVAGTITPIDDTTKQIEMTTELDPTVSPDDPNFEEWYKEHKADWDNKANQQRFDD